MDHRNHIMNIDGSTFSHVELVNGDRNTGPRPDVGELQRLLREHRAELVRLADTKGDRARVHLDELEEAVGEEQPDAARVRYGWDSVLRVLKGGAAAAESVSKITDVIRSLFGT